MCVSQGDNDTFHRLFVPVLQGLSQVMRGLALDSDDYRQPLSILAELCELKVGTSRPLCGLVCKLVVFDKGLHIYISELFVVR